MCSSLVYGYTGSVSTSLFLHQGCYNDDSCSGKFKVVYSYTASPSSSPSSKVPTYLPTGKSTNAPSSLPSSPPTSYPSNDPSYYPTSETSNAPTIYPTSYTTSFGNECASFSTSNTNFASNNYAVCKIQICPGTTVTISDCSETCVGDQYINLFDGKYLSYLYLSLKGYLRV